MRITRTSIRFALACMLALPIECQVITTVAGNSTWGNPYDVTVDAAGNQYVVDGTKHVIYKVDRLANTTTVAGKGTAGYSGDGGLATNAALNSPRGVAVDAAGNLYIADYGNDRIRKVGTDGIITTFAGTTRQGFSGDGGPATSAQISAPIGLALDAAGNLYFVDSGNYRIRKITPTGIISTVAGIGRRGYSGDGSPATLAEITPARMAFGPDGSLYFGDDGPTNLSGTPRVRKVAPDGTISTVAGSGTRGYAGDGGPALAAAFRSVDGIAVDPMGNLFISEFVAHRVRKVSASGIVTTYAGTGTSGYSGDGGPATSARLADPLGLATDGAGNLYIADRGNDRIRKVSPPAAPTIGATNSVVPSFLGSAGFSSNTYIEIYGSNLSATTRTWSGSDFTGSTAPTSLDGVSVTVNGKAAFVYFVSPGQININTPDDTATGPVAIQVKTSVGTSNVVMANRAPVSPTLQSVPQFNTPGKEYVVAQTLDFSSFIGRPNMVSGVSFTPAKPGDSVIIYALGCGATSPATQAGTVTAQNSLLALPYELRIGGVAASVTFAGAVAGSIGLYQLNVVIPNVPAGDQPIELVVGGVSNAQNLSIVVGQ